MTKQHMEFIAGVISNLPRENAVRMTAAQQFADHLRIVNPRFNERLFMDACRVPQLVIPADRLRKGDFVCGYGTVQKVTPRDPQTFVEFQGSIVTIAFLDHEPVRIERQNGN